MPIEPSLRILVVDDSAISRKMVEFALAGQPYESRFAKDGEEALSLFRSILPHVVLTDSVMPGISGAELCCQIRALRATKTHIILMSSNAKDDDIDIVRNSGIDHYLAKPIDPVELLVKLEAVCEI